MIAVIKQAIQEIREVKSLLMEIRDMLKANSAVEK